MISTVFVLWMFLSNGNVVTQVYPDLDSCLATQRAIQLDQQIRGKAAVDRILCLPEDVRVQGQGLAR